MGEKIGQRLGKLLAVEDTLENGGWAEFLRIRVEIDVLKPLRRTIKIGGGKGKDVRGRVSYERLPMFCYCCGHLGHSEGDCTVNEEKEAVDPATFQYGNWLDHPL